MCVDRIPNEPRTIDVANDDEVHAAAAELEVSPDEVREAVGAVGPIRTAVEIWLGRAQA